MYWLYIDSKHYPPVTSDSPKTIVDRARQATRNPIVKVTFNLEDYRGMQLKYYKDLAQCGSQWFDLETSHAQLREGLMGRVLGEGQATPIYASSKVPRGDVHVKTRKARP